MVSMDVWVSGYQSLNFLPVMPFSVQKEFFPIGPSPNWDGKVQEQMALVTLGELNHPFSVSVLEALVGHHTGQGYLQPMLSDDADVGHDLLESSGHSSEAVELGFIHRIQAHRDSVGSSTFQGYDTIFRQEESVRLNLDVSFVGSEDLQEMLQMVSEEWLTPCDVEPEDIELIQFVCQAGVVFQCQLLACRI